MKIKSLCRHFLRLNHESLSKQGPFWLSIVIPSMISFLLCIPLWEKTTIDLSAEGYGKFLDIFKLPIGILSLAIPFVAIVAHIHRTIQTAEQIKSTREKNISDSFFSHHKFMTETFSKIPEKTIDKSDEEYICKIEDPYHIYNFLFKDSSSSKGVQYSNLKNRIIEINECIVAMAHSLEKARKNKNEGEHNLTLLHELFNQILSLEQNLSVTRINKKRNSLIMYRNANNNIFKTVIPYDNELELKQKINTNLYFANKISQTVNEKIEIPDAIYFYCIIEKERYLYFSNEFSDSLKADEKPTHAFSSLNSKIGNIHEQYISYTHELQRNKKSKEYEDMEPF
ncbi:TPA: hypothetical protein PXO91_001761 [Yersinia enterocolitica]|nr:hypothetical protein [Yersinia enterocolitica]